MFTRAGQPTSMCCVAACGRGVREGTMLLALLSAGFQSFPLLPTSRLSPSGADSLGRWFCIYSRTMWVSLSNSPVRMGVSPAAASTPTGVFIQRFEALFPGTGILGCEVCHRSTSCCLAHPSPPATALLQVLSAQLPVSAPPTGLDECFFFNSLVVGLPYSWIFCQF